MEKILGYANNLTELMTLIADCENGIIILNRLIDCSNCSLYLSYGKILRGKTIDCGLKFEMDQSTEMPLILLKNTALENMTIEAKVNKVEVEHCSGAVMVTDTLVKFKNLRINLAVEDQNFVDGKLFPALYLLHRVECEEILSITAKGMLASAIGGNFSATASLKMLPGAKLCVNLVDSICPGITKCMVEIEEGTFVYENLSKNASYEEFQKAYVFLIGNCETYGQVKAEIKMTPESFLKKRMQMFRPAIARAKVNFSVPWYVRFWNWIYR